MRAHWPILIFLAPFLAAIATPMLGLRYRGACRPLALLALSAMSLASLLAYREVLTGGEIRYALSGWDPPFGIEWVLDGLSGIMAVILSLLSLIAMVYAGPTTPKDMGGRIVPWYTLILLMVSALAGMVFAADLFNLFVFLEVAALSSYALIGVAGGRALMAAFRYLIVGTIGGFLFLLGIAYFYAATGTLNMADLAQQLPALLGSKAVLAGLIFIFIGLAIKMALVPFHGWVPDAYADAPDAISPLLASLVTKTTLYAVIRITFWVLGAGVIIDKIPLLLVLGWAGILTTLVGAFLALSQQDIKRMFAYSGVSHIGLIVIGVSLGNATGFAGGMFALIAEAVMLALLFFVSGALFYRGGVRNIDDLVHLRGQMPWTVTAFIVTALSMVGIPPTGGFFGKWYILLGALEAQNYVALAAIIISSLLTLAYFLKIIRTLVFEQNPPPEPRRIEEAPFAMRISMAVLTAAIIGLGLGSDWVMAALLASAIPAGL